MSADPVIAWLLEPSEPSLQFRTLRELLDVPPDDPKVVAALQSIPGSQAKGILRAISGLARAA